MQVCVLTGVLGMLWLLGHNGAEFSEDVDSWRVRGLWRDECMLARVVQGLLESRKILGETGRKGKQKKNDMWV